MKILVDMNLAPAWIAVLRDGGHDAAHWSFIGRGDASDKDILSWASANGYVLFTHDLDFGAILAATGASAPSVIQLRTQDVSPGNAAKILLDSLDQFQSQLTEGALISLDERHARARILPLMPPKT